MNNFKVNTLISNEVVLNKIAILKDDTVISYDSLSLNHEIKMSDKDDDNYDIDIITKSAPKTKKPALYQVVLLNDDYTPMDFVISVLEHFFNKGHDEATQIMLEVHQKGVGIAGVFTYEVAETKVAQVSNFSRQHEHPLQCTMEKI